MKAFGSLFLSLLLWMPLRAQFINDGGNIDRERYNFGFSLALNYGSFDVVKRGNYQDAFEYEDINGNLETVESLAAIRSIGKPRSEEHTCELQSLMRITSTVYSLKKKKNITKLNNKQHTRR